MGSGRRLARLYRVLGIPGEEVLNVYLVGSRLFGVNKPGADYDLKVVIRDDSSYTGPAEVQRSDRPEEGRYACSCDEAIDEDGDDDTRFEVDAHIYPLRTFLDRVEDQDPQVLTCLFLPTRRRAREQGAASAAATRGGREADEDEDEEERWVWKETVPIEYFPRLTKLYRSVYHEADTNWSKAFRLWRRRDRLVARLAAAEQDSGGAEAASTGVLLVGRPEDDDPTLLHYRAKKCIVHAIRFAHFGLQIAQHGAIVDYQVANDLFYEVLPEERVHSKGNQDDQGDKKAGFEDSSVLQTPSYYESKYEPTLRSLIRQLKAYAASETKKAEDEAGEDPLPSIMSKNVPSRRKGKKSVKEGSQIQDGYVSELRTVLHFLNSREHGVKELSRNFGVKVKKSVGFNKLYHLSYSDSSSPMNCPLVRACRALVLAREDNEWKVACYPFPKFFYYGPQQIFERGNRDPSRLLRLPQDVEEGPIEVTAQLKGVMVTIYRHQNKWLVNNLASPDGSHYFPVQRHSSIAERRKFNLNTVSSIPLEDYFWQVWQRKHTESAGHRYRLPPASDETTLNAEVSSTEDQPTAKTRCYIFEFTSPHLQVVSIKRPHIENELTDEELAKEENINLLAVRDLQSLNLLGRNDVESIADSYGWDCVPCYRFPSLDEAVRAANALPFHGDSKGLVLQVRLPGPTGGREVMVRLPSSTFIAYVNIKERPSDEEKKLDPDAWEWHKEDYDFDSMNRLCMLEIVRWQYCTNTLPGNEEELASYLRHWNIEHQNLYTHVKQTFTDYNEQLQAEFDLIIEGMLRAARMESPTRDVVRGEEQEQRKRLLHTSLRIMSADEKRWFAQEVALSEQRRGVSHDPKSGDEPADPYRALLFEMKKEGFATVQELMARVHIKYLEELLFATKNNKVILV